MKVRIVLADKKGRFNVTQFETDDVAASLTDLGWTVTGFENHPQRRAELQGQPKTLTLIGPMYDGPDTIRYENQDAYNILSAGD